MGFDSIGSTASDDCEEHSGIRKREKTSRRRKSIDKQRRSTSIEKPRRRPSIDRTGSSVGSLGYESTVKTTDKDGQENKNTDKQIKPRRSQSIGNTDHSTGRKSGRGQSVDKSAKRTIERPKSIDKQRRSTSIDKRRQRHSIGMTGSSESVVKDRQLKRSGSVSSSGDDNSKHSSTKDTGRSVGKSGRRDSRMKESKSTEAKDRERSHLSIAAAASILPHTNNKKITGRQTSFLPNRTSDSSSATKSWLKRIGEF